MKHARSSNAVAIEDRVRGALWGSLAGDAFCLGSHWIYSLNELSQRFPGGINGFETPAPGHYHFGKKTGDFTHYGDVALLMLSSVAACGHLEAADFGARLTRLMMEEKYAGYRDHAIQGLLANYRAHLERLPDVPFDYQQGADDDQPATVTHLAPVVVAHLNSKDLLETVATATRVCQNNDRAIAFTQAAALILRNLLNGSDLETAVIETRKVIGPPDKAWSEVNKRMKMACAARMIPAIDATMLFGQSCPLYSSFTAALHTALVCSDDFAKAVQTTAQAGGDSAGRAAMIGAWLGALLGVQAIPESWRTSLTAHDRIEADVEKLVTCVAQPVSSIL